MDDFISRQAAIDEIARWIGYLDEDMINRIQIGLKRLPSAQEQKERDCSTCKHKDLCDAFWTQEIEDAPCSECDELAYQKWEPQELTNNSQKLDSENDEHLATDLQPNLQPCNQDCISRQAAIDALEKSRFPGAPYIDRGILIALS